MMARAIMVNEMALATATGARSVQAAELVDGDAELLRAIAHGDRLAFDRMSRRHLDRAYGVALRMTGSRADAEDVVQEVFLRLWTRPDAWRPGQAQFSTWLYRVVVNRCLDLKRRPKGTDLESVEEPQAPDANAEESLLDAERNRALDGAVAQLPERQRTAIVLTYTAGLRNAEAASAMDISVKAFEALLVRAKRELRDHLAGQGWIQP
ncbi:RNA polymerase sigma factor [Dongia deserti]|uniref:RNA polymerase sigma factor n=1 Tax=Dongia deserti TaxID=2268030 RepID=UPI0025485D79|nr:RNA polymerase sigma factor [Dongia deserti]